MDIFAKIIGIVAGLFAIYSGLKGLIPELKNKTKNKKSISKYSSFIAIGLIIVVSFIYIYSKNVKLENHSKLERAKYDSLKTLSERERLRYDSLSTLSKRERIRYELNRYRDKIFEIRSEYNTIEINGIDSTNLAKLAKLLNNSVKSFKDLKKIYVPDSWLGLYIYKFDHLTYFSTIASALESLLENKQNAVQWANEAISVSKIAFQYISRVKSDFKKDSLNKSFRALNDWIQDDNIENRLRFLRGMSLAIKLYFGDINTRPRNVEKEIESITTTAYLIEYPLKGNPHFERIKEQLNENFLKTYYYLPSADKPGIFSKKPHK